MTKAGDSSCGSLPLSNGVKVRTPCQGKQTQDGQGGYAYHHPFGIGWVDVRSSMSKLRAPDLLILCIRSMSGIGEGMWKDSAASRISDRLGIVENPGVELRE